MAAKAKRRNYAAEYKARQARAQAKGFAGYYEQRIKGGKAGTPGAERPSGERLRRARGHQSLRDFERELKPGSLVEVTDYTRDKQGRITSLSLLVTDENGREREYIIRGKALDVDRLLKVIDDRGAIDSPLYGLDHVFAHTGYEAHGDIPF